MPPTYGGTPPQPPTYGEYSPYNMQISLKHTDTQGSQPMSGECKTYGEESPYGRRCPACKGGVQHVRGPLTPHNMQMPPRTYRCIEEYGKHMGVCEHTGGVQTYGGIQMYGRASRSPPSIKNMPATKKS